MVVGTGVVRHGRRRNGPSAIAGQLETLGSCAGSGVQVLKGCVSYPAKLSAAPHAQPSRNEKDATPFAIGKRIPGGRETLPLPTFPSRSRQGRSARHPALRGRSNTQNADGKPCGGIGAGGTFLLARTAEMAGRRILCLAKPARIFPLVINPSIKSPLFRGKPAVGLAGCRCMLKPRAESLKPVVRIG